MKTIQLIPFLMILMLLAGCQEVDLPDFSSDNTMGSITCTVVLEEKMNATGSRPEDLTARFTGSISSNGIITFPGINELTEEQKQRARFSAIIPLTATLVEKDGSGKVIGSGIGGIRTLSKKTYYFHVIAANGDERKYVLTFN